MTNGEMDTNKVSTAMRTLATSILSTGDVKKKVYPTNFVEPETTFVAADTEGSSYGAMNQPEEEESDQDFVEMMAGQGFRRPQRRILREGFGGNVSSRSRLEHGPD